ncbi:MAG TPA: C-terminal binding protein [Casimicrobium huifangae]|jgi:D-3-phosphoglycerate dehydrogenase|uniref:C-terminal binding protein n=1 Tax=Casimicrobium huifangae TaxID=2591109 RepID=UPI0012EBEA9E|nr:C-terminal binding protein [Casimicrobium huifangae]HOB02091.1 C-terminal binding protein [Casimicrobium huifangae]HQA33858.1 C-terminal binding protein [Casimicrobium huifangae]HQD65053.1 C-terminal binding protein [Casimicrobium huifangae]
MPVFLLTDFDAPNFALEEKLFADAGMRFVTAQARSEDEVIAAATACNADGLLIQYAPVTERVLSALPRVGICSRIGAGFDTIDPKACAKLGVWLANSPDYGVGEVATHALALALDIIRGTTFHTADIRAGKWHYESNGKRRRATEMTLGIVGLGRIGKRMAHVSRNLFKRVIAYDPYLIDGDFPAFVERVRDLHELFRQADVVSPHVPLNDETRGMIDAACFAAMKPRSYVVNTARGAVINIPDLLAALDSGQLDSAGLDVLPDEPALPGERLTEHPRVVLTPHSAFYSVESEIELRTKAARNLITWARTGRPDYPVVMGTKTLLPA